MKDKIKLFRELIEQTPANCKKKSDDLVAFKDELKEARLKGFTYRQIALFLREVGLPVSKDTVRTFCMSALGEQPVRRSSTRKKPSQKKSSPSLDSSKTNETTAINHKSPVTQSLTTKPHGMPPKGFRVAGDKF